MVVPRLLSLGVVAEECSADGCDAAGDEVSSVGHGILEVGLTLINLKRSFSLLAISAVKPCLLHPEMSAPEAQRTHLLERPKATTQRFGWRPLVGLAGFEPTTSTPPV